MQVAGDNHEVLVAHQEMLIDGLKRIFGEFDQEMLRRVLPRVEWVEVAGGERLFRQGELDASLCFVISGRLRATRMDEEGVTQVLGEIARGETVGEMAFFTGEPRTATVTAVRDCVLARFSQDVFRELLIAYPLISLNMTRLVIERLQKASALRQPGGKPVTIGLAAISPGVDLDGFARTLARHLDAHGRTIVVDAQAIGQWLGDAQAAQAPMHDTDRSRRVVRKLEEVETEHQFVLFVADPSPSGWTRRCLRHCDEIVLVADAGADAAPHPIEIECLSQGDAVSRVARTLVLLHPTRASTPVDTQRWLRPRELAGHVHMRAELARDWQRLARLVSGNAVGLVLSGGGARGFAHLGVMRALEEAGIACDLAGGTSIGAVMAAYAAMDLPMAEVIANAREAFRANPTGDYNLVPMMSLIGGRRLKQVIDQAVLASTGHDIGIEDLWKGYYCVSSNYSSASEAVLTQGPLAKSVRASVSIPGALPPVMLEGDLHIDGGTFNNFPTDVMSRFGASRIIGVNLLRDRSIKYDLDEVPSPGRLLRDKLRGHRHRLPSLTSLLLNTSMMYSYARQKESRRYVDLYFSPAVHRYGMLEWAQFDRIVQAGYDYAREVIEREGGIQALSGRLPRVADTVDGADLAGLDPAGLELAA